jgi:putative restriction endonuclease
MPDPLDSVTSALRREQLARIREMDGMIESSTKLREIIPGFRGQKGIYKPAGSDHALWIRQTLRRAYPDKELIVNPDGSWVYDYAPEGRAGHPDMSLDTNRALLRCLEDGAPVGVIRQVPSAGERRYEVRGLGYVTEFDGSHFRLRGEPIDISDRPVRVPSRLQFEPFDRRFPQLSSSLRRSRYERFKIAIRRVYHEKCSLCNMGYHLGQMPLALEAAHLIPVEAFGTSKDVRNGMLLCSNHHALFDNYAWTIDEDLRVLVTADEDFRRSATSNHVLRVEGRRLPNLPDQAFEAPDPVAARYRMDLFGKNEASQGR